MRIINIGSLNIDHVYVVDQFVRPGETISCRSFERFAGGKGLNQSVAAARAGAAVMHAGKIGSDGIWLREFLVSEGIDTEMVEVTEYPTGHAIIQVNSLGQNAIIIHGGANKAIRPEDVRRIVGQGQKGDFLLLQNETSCVAEAICEGHERGLRVAFNPAPMESSVTRFPLSLVDVFVLNEIEGAELAGVGCADRILEEMSKRYPHALTVLTLGERGAAYVSRGERGHVPSVSVRAVDSTAAGDTFTGYLVARLSAGSAIREAIEVACRAAAICVTREGAAKSIPYGSEVT